jgi:isopenicillin N synthase-like dioxygenase
MSSTERQEKVEKISYTELLNPTAETFQAIKDAFGHEESLGLILISDIPQFTTLRHSLLKLGPKLAALNPTQLKSLEDTKSQFMFGWSHGREFMNGKYDFSKGSFYANPQYDQPTDDPQMMRKYPEYCHPNLWPDLGLPELKPAFQQLGRLMVDTGVLLGRLCDRFLVDCGLDRWGDCLEQMIKSSRSNKGRFLHYFPSPVSDGGSPESDNGNCDNNESLDSWCGWHLDHSCLTALTSPMYLDGDNCDCEICPSDDSGLYIKSKSGRLVKVNIPCDCMAFQTGEALEILTKYLTTFLCTITD